MFAEMMSKVDNHIDFIIEMVNEGEVEKQVPENLKEGFETSFNLIKSATQRFGVFDYKNGFVTKNIEDDED